MVMCRQKIFVLAMLLFSVVAMHAASVAETRAYSAAAKSFEDKIWWHAEAQFAEFNQEFPASERRTEAILFQAQAMIHQTNSSAALGLLTANLGAAGKFADEYQFWMAEAYFQLGDFTKAAEAYVEVRRFATSPRRIEALVNEAAAHAAQTNWSRVVAVLGGADSEFTQVVRSEPTNPHVTRGLLLLGKAQLELNNHEAVEAALASLVGKSLGGDLDWRAERLRYLARFAQGQWAGALTASSNLVVLATNVPANRAAVLSESVVLRADALERSGQRAEARVVLEKNLAPGSPAHRQEHALLKITELALAEGRLAAANDTLARFLDLSSNSPAAATALLSLGEIHLRQAAGHFNTNASAPSAEATNHLNTALGLFDRLVATHTNSPLAGRAELNRGWSLWLKGQINDSAVAFERATGKLGDSDDLVVARFKLGDALFAQKDFARALPAYQSALEASARWPRTRAELGEDLLHQILRSSLEVTNIVVATNAMAQIMDLQPHAGAADGSLLQLVQKLGDVGQSELASSEYEKFIALVPDFSRRAEIELLLGQAQEQQGDWAAAIARYERWLTQYSTNLLRPKVEYLLAWANSRAGSETNALQQFAEFAARYPTNSLAPEAQWWVADWYFRQPQFPKAEEKYKANFQTWPKSWLAREAVLRAGCAALEGTRVQDAISYFTNLTSDVNCPADLRARALFHYGGALMAQPAAGTN
jgi:TolA-binding protein